MMRRVRRTLAERRQIRRTRRRLRAGLQMRRKLGPERRADRRIQRALSRLDWTRVPYRSGEDSFGSMLRMAMWIMEE